MWRFGRTILALILPAFFFSKNALFFFFSIIIKMGLSSIHYYFLMLLTVSEISLTVYGFYYARNEANPLAVSALWATNFVFPICAGLLIGLMYACRMRQTYLFSGVIAGASVYCTMTLPSLVAYYIMLDDMVGIGISLGTLASVCIGNATLSMLLARFVHNISTVPNMLPKSKVSVRRRRP